MAAPISPRPYTAPDDGEHSCILSFMVASFFCFLTVIKFKHFAAINFNFTACRTFILFSGYFINCWPEFVKSELISDSIVKVQKMPNNGCHTHELPKSENICQSNYLCIWPASSLTCNFLGQTTGAWSDK